MHTLERRTRLPASAERAFAWHESTGAFQRLTPPWQRIEVEERLGIADGERLVMRIKLGPLSIRWVALHSAYEKDRQFRDTQESGPFAHWEHTHRFEPVDDRQCTLHDTIRFEAPAGKLGNMLAGITLDRMLQRMFDYRHETTSQDLAMHEKYQGADLKRVAITGATGMVGEALSSYLSAGGKECLPISRTSGKQYITWDPMAGSIDKERLEGVDAVVHLAGESIADRRWSEKQKQRIRDSRVHGTRLLATTIAQLSEKPKVLVSASAVGIYGDRGDAVLDETSSAGDDFLAHVCRDWEASTEAAEAAGIRVVHARLGVILSPKGGALPKMLLPARFWGGKLGSGKQFMSWVDLDDVLGAIHHALATESLAGAMNVTAPQPVTNQEFTEVLGKVIGRIPLFPAPTFALKLALGEMAQAMLLSSARVLPRRLEETGYAFRNPDLEASLRHQLGR